MDFILDQHPWGIEGDIDHYIVGAPTPSPDQNFFIIDKPGHLQFVAKDKEAAEKLRGWLKMIADALEQQIAAPPRRDNK